MYSGFAPAGRVAPKISYRAAIKAGACVAALAAGFSGAAYAQEETTDRVTITGSRIARTGLTTPTPVTAVNAEEMDQIAPGNLIEVFDALPQFLGNSSAGTGSNFAGAAGASNLNMRGLNSKRTLVLLNGRRVVSANRLGTVDINMFPEAVVERVEVVTGGASAAYGTDAVAGVTNFILDTDFTGVSAEAQAGITSRGDNENGSAQIAFGTQLGDRLHFLASAEYYKSAEVRSFKDRDWYDGWGVVTNPAWRGYDTGTGPERVRAPNVVSIRSSFGGIITSPGSALNYTHFLSDGTPAPFQFSDLAALDPVTGRPRGTFSQSVTNGGSGDNIRADPNRKAEGSVQLGVERASAFSYLEFEATPNLNLYLQGIYGFNEGVQRGGSTVMEDAPYQATIYPGNPYLPASVAAVMQAEVAAALGAGRPAPVYTFSRNHSSADLAQGRLRQTNDTYSLTGGFNYVMQTGGFLNDWTVDGYYQYGRNENHIELRNFIRADRLFTALDAVRHPTTGQIVCNVTLFDPNSDCIPINLFGAGQASQESIDYVLGGDRRDKDIFATVEQHVAEVSGGGEIFEGFGAGPVSLAVGASYREDSFEQTVGPADLIAMTIPSNNPALGIRGVPPGFAGRPVHQFSTAQDLAGSYDVKEVFAETLVPLLSGVTMFEQVDLSLAARYADYSGSGGIWAWKAGVDWQVYSDLRLRGTLSRDVRAGTLSERFDWQGQGGSARDPLFNNESFAFNTTIGGNPNVDPEKADTITLGAVYQPSWLPGLGLSVDWYDIKLKGAIGQLGTQRIVDDCFAGAAEQCANIVRDPTTNRIVHVYNLFQNIAGMRVNGVDVEVSYATDVNLFGTGDESLRLRALAAFLTENSTTNPGAPKVDSAGVGELFDTGVTVNATYDIGDFSVFLQGRYMGDGKLSATWIEGREIDDLHVDSVFYTDLNLTWRPEGKSWEVFGNAQNIFDVAPPLAPGFLSGFSGSTQTNEGAYDLLGARFTTGVRMNF
jgi:outer membrane receptor protein involved in Fe transport